ncbi:MAG: P27 family phage terminase small subunit [Planctomycetota bacterium]
MGKHGPRKRPRDTHGLPTIPPPSGVKGADIEKPQHVADDAVASAVFDKCVGFLAARGDLRKSHELALGLLAGEWSRHVGAARIARETPIVDGPRGPKAHPAAGIAAAAARVARDLLADFGLTPASLARIDVPEQPAGPSVIDRFVAKRAGSKVTPADRALTPEQRHTLLYGTDAEKAAVVADVVEDRKMFA